MDCEILEVKELAHDVLNLRTVIKLLQYKHHKNTNVFKHSLAVAVLSVKYANLLEKIHIKVDKKSLVRGALLHDYFLYDWHLPHHKLHGFTHPKIAYLNAIRDFHVNKIEANIIKRHMFPLTLIPPTRRESFIVCIADKVCAIKELITRKNKGEQ